MRFTSNSLEKLPSFEDLLAFMNGQSQVIKGKEYELKLLNSTLDGCIAGLVITTQDKEIAPKRNKVSGDFGQVGIDPSTEGLAYANVFLYDSALNVLVYEVNGDGCYLDSFIEFAYRTWNFVYEDLRFDLSFPVVARKDEYERVLNMTYYKRLIVELTNPSELVNLFQQNNLGTSEVVAQNVRSGNRSNADTVKIEQVVYSKQHNPEGLNRIWVKGVIDTVIQSIIDKGKKGFVKKLHVDGYATNVEDPNSMKPVDLLTDSFNEYFRIPEVQIHSDLQETQRRDGIEGLYLKISPELRSIFS